MNSPLDQLDADDQATTAEAVRAQRKAQREIKDLQWLMSDKRGRRIVWRWLSDSGLFQNPFNNSGSVTAFNCGRMNEGQRLLARIMEHAPEAYSEMQKEQRNDD